MIEIRPRNKKELSLPYRSLMKISLGQDVPAKASDVTEETTKAFDVPDDNTKKAYVTVDTTIA